LWSTEGLEIVDDGGRFSRLEKTRRIAHHPLVRRSLRVCWRTQAVPITAGRCRKLPDDHGGPGGAWRPEEDNYGFPAEFDLGAMSSLKIIQTVTLALWEDVLEAAAGKPELERAVGIAVTKRKARPRPTVQLPAPAADRRRSPDREAGSENEIVEIVLLTR